MTEAGPLILIGGHEDKEGDRLILKEVAERVRGRKLVIATVASREPEEYFETYCRAFENLGVGELVELYVENRLEAQESEALQALEGAAGVFFTGGDQSRITSRIGDTPIHRRVREIHRSGGLIAGTSAGASAMSDAMLVSGASAESPRIGDLETAAGLSLICDVIIDQHFAERGRIGRLLGAVAQNPQVLGVGIDEDTAIVVGGAAFRVLGRGGVYVVDGVEVTCSNLAEAKPDRALSICDVRMHVLSHGDRFRFADRRPETAAPRREPRAISTAAHVLR